jgi:hypothetical protein
MYKNNQLVFLGGSITKEGMKDGYRPITNDLVIMTEAFETS